MSAGYGEECYRQLAERYAAATPLKSTCKPEDVAETIVWVVESARQVTGETIFVDSGMHIASLR